MELGTTTTSLNGRAAPEAVAPEEDRTLPGTVVVPQKADDIPISGGADDVNVAETEPTQLD